MRRKEELKMKWIEALLSDIADLLGWLFKSFPAIFSLLAIAGILLWIWGHGLYQKIGFTAFFILAIGFFWVLYREQNIEP
ncbi:MAG TPA: hypothetical protein VLX68_01330 [Chitinivibrionales bacterium]|nr:hypothetical protein [Chitinivibrionales bacterium]